jgi:hypothetical protein
MISNRTWDNITSLLDTPSKPERFQEAWNRLRRLFGYVEESTTRLLEADDVET